MRFEWFTRIPRSSGPNDHPGATGCSRRLLSCVAASARLQQLPGRLSLPSSGCRSCGIYDGGGAISPRRWFLPAEMSTSDCDCAAGCARWVHLPPRTLMVHRRYAGMTIPWTLIPYARKSQFEENPPWDTSRFFLPIFPLLKYYCYFLRRARYIKDIIYTKREREIYIYPESQV